jgi:hypothetical protein
MLYRLILSVLVCLNVARGKIAPCLVDFSKATGICDGVLYDLSVMRNASGYRFGGICLRNHSQFSTFVTASGEYSYYIDLSNNGLSAAFSGCPSPAATGEPNVFLRISVKDDFL